jgi:hypothetical protein
MPFLEPEMPLPPFKQTPLNINMALPNNPFVKPAPPPNRFFQAIELDKQQRHREAEKIYNELLNADFDNPILVAAMGMCFASQEKNALGAHLLRHALQNIEGMIEGFQRPGHRDQRWTRRAQHLFQQQTGRMPQRAWHLLQARKPS